jgi:cytidine deaminase
MSLSKEEQQGLIDAANEVRRHAYVPYSHYPVGAALRTKSGHVFTGVNVENAAYPTTICAERTAVFKAVSEGEREFDSIAVVTDKAVALWSCRWCGLSSAGRSSSSPTETGAGRR